MENMEVRMRIFKVAISVILTMFLAGLIITQNNVFAVCLLVFSSLRIGVMMGEKYKDKG